VRKNNPGVRIHRTKFVDSVKKSKETGKESARSRGVIVGTTMVQGRDYYSSYSACARMMGFKITMVSVLAKMRSINWIPFFIDLKQAHQNTLVESRLPRDMYCFPLPGFDAPEDKPRIVWRMNTCAQGSPQAARLFSEDVIDTLRKGGFTQSYNDDALFQKGDQRGKGAELAQWVDDFVGGAHPDEIDAIEALFRARWPDCTIMRDWRNVLGNDVSIDWERCSASISLRAAIKKLSEAVFGPVAPPRTTMPYTSRIATLKPSAEPDEKSLAHAPWKARQGRVRKWTGMLVHISQWEPSIVYPTSRVAGVMAAPCEAAEEEVKGIAAYLHHRMNEEIVIGGPHVDNLDSVEPTARAYSSGMPLPPCALAFADGALGEVDAEGKSMSGVVIMVGYVCVLALSARQHCVAKDSHDTEIYAGSLAATLMISVRDQLREKGWIQIHPSYLFTDSSSTLAVVESVNRLHRSLHLARRVFLMRMAEVEGDVKFVQTPGAINKADPMTKAVLRAVFLAARDFWHGKITS
jgi:hypothetical protein